MCLLQGRCNNDASSFRVLSVQHLRHGRGQKLHAIEYDSQRQSWNHHVDWDTLKNIEIEGNEQGKVMHAGNLIFWKYNCTSLLLLDTRKMQFSVLRVPCDINPKSYAIGEIEDGVCCLAAVDSVGELNTLHLRVWKLEKLEWKMEKEMQVRKVLGKHAPRGHSYYRVRKIPDLCDRVSDLVHPEDLITQEEGSQWSLCCCILLVITGVEVDARDNIEYATEIICTVSSFLICWAELQHNGDKEGLAEGAEIPETTVLQMHPHQAPRDDEGMVLLH
ncbi:hypothetical protein HU200_045805 [Digitaria exilis]|uniref:Uncharacterized protein n=1 Tax=Digitaria exilis TaxID=1010633 RepID=A0A835EBF9_9POAL|nr:hypothetical protein HU200_045805 [Digitaria exilis]